MPWARCTRASGGGSVGSVPGRKSAQGRPARAQPSSPRRPTLGRFQQDPPAVLDGDSSAAVLIAPSLSPILLNRPAFRVFSYDRVGLLLDYVQHGGPEGQGTPMRASPVAHAYQPTAKPAAEVLTVLARNWARA